MEYFNILPEEITLDILTRLPAESVLECKFVCKPWRNLVSHHPSFSKPHLNRLRDSGNLSFLFGYFQFYYFDYNETTHETNSRRINLIPPQLNSYTVVGSCNGLICFKNHHGSIMISNPMIKEYVMLPKLRPDARRDEPFICGFGYLPMTDEYKVVRMFKLQKESFEVEVYTLGSGNGWRYVRKLDCGFTGHIGVFANGALHWLDSGEKVVAFGLADEMVRYNPLPTILQRGYLSSLHELTIWALGDYLMRVDDKLMEGVRTIDRWLLKIKNGLQDTTGEVDCNRVNWSEEFSLDDIRMEPFSFTESGAMLCMNYLAEHSTLHRYDVKSSSLEMLASIYKCFGGLPFPHMNTLVSSKALGEENTKKWNQFSVQKADG